MTSTTPTNPITPTTPTTPATAVPGRRRSVGFWHAAWYRFRRNKLALVSAVVALIIVLVALLAPFIAPYGYATQDLLNPLADPSWDHPFGTDQLGRDTLSRAIYGAQLTMAIAIGAPLLGSLIGIPIGIASGWFGRIADYVSLRAFEVFTMVPPILLALLLIALFGSGVGKLTVFIGVTLWVGFARLTRAQYISLRNRDFVEAARALGVPSWRIVTIHMFPNAAGPIIVYFVQQIPGTIFAAAGFSFLGLGVQNPLADWGKMINDGGQYLQISPLVALVPIICIALATLSFSFVGDGLRDALDPTSR